MFRKAIIALAVTAGVLLLLLPHASCFAPLPLSSSAVTGARKCTTGHFPLTACGGPPSGGGVPIPPGGLGRRWWGGGGGGGDGGRRSSSTLMALTAASLHMLPEGDDAAGTEPLAVTAAHYRAINTRRGGSRGFGGTGRGLRRRPSNRGKFMGVTSLILLVNLSVYVMQNINPSLTMAGAKVAHKILRRGQWYRLFTPMVLHASPSHLMMNSYALFNIGPLIEQFFGQKRMLSIYILSGVGGNVLSCIVNPAAVGVGASGAIAGLVGCAAVFFSENQQVFGQSAQRALGSIGQTIVLNVVVGMNSGSIDNMAHLGGLLAGAMATFIVGPRLRWTTNPYTGQTVLQDFPRFSRQGKPSQRSRF